MKLTKLMITTSLTTAFINLAEYLKVNVLPPFSGKIRETTLNDSELMIAEQNSHSGLLGKNIEPVALDISFIGSILHS